VLLTLCQIVRRTGNLTVEEKEERRAQTQAKHYNTHKRQILQKSRERREKINTILRVTEKLGRFAASSKKQHQEVRSKVDDLLTAFQQLYGISGNFDIETFLERNSPDDPPDLATFPRLVAFFLPFQTLPETSQSDYLTKKVGEVIPNASHYREVSLRIHPDKSSTFSQYQALLNDAFALWDQILKIPGLKDLPAPPQDTNLNAEYCEKGDIYRSASDIYLQYVFAHTKAYLLMTSPTSGSLQGVYETLVEAEEAGKLVHASLDDEDTGMQDLENGIDEAVEKAKEAAQLQSRRQKRRSPEDNEDDPAGRGSDEEEGPGEEEDDLPDPAPTRKRQKGRGGQRDDEIDVDNPNIDPNLRGRFNLRNRR
jgi:hypothetical protein